MPAVCRLVLPHATLLAALCGTAAAQTFPDSPTPAPFTPIQALGTVGFSPSSVGTDRPGPSGVRGALASTDPAVARVQPMGLVLSRLSAPRAWADLPDAGRAGRTGMTAQDNEAMSLDQVLGRGDRLLEATDTPLPGGLLLTRTRTKRLDASPPQRPDHIPTSRETGTTPSQLASASMLQLRLNSGTTLATGQGGLASRSLGLGASSLSTRLAGIEAVVAHPLVALVPEHRFASASTPLGGAWTGRAAIVRGKGCEPACADVNLLELTYQDRRHAINLSMGTLHEHASMGELTPPRVATPATRTTSLSLSAAWALDKEWLVAASYAAARAMAPLDLGRPTRVAANGYAFGLLKTDTWRAGDRLSLTAQAPLGARTGALTHDGDAAATPLRPDAREWTIETRYTARLSDDSTVTAAAAYRQNPDHDATADGQMAIGMRYTRLF